MPGRGARGWVVSGRPSIGTITRLGLAGGFVRAVDGREASFSRMDALRFDSLAVGDTVLFDLRDEPGGPRAHRVHRKDVA